MIDAAQAARLRDSSAHVLDPAGERVGKVAEIFLDDVTGEPAWVTVAGGFLGSARTLVPLHGASVRDDDLHLAYGKEIVKNAPHIAADHSITPAEEERLWAHYAAPAAGADES